MQGPSVFCQVDCNKGTKAHEESSKKEIQPVKRSQAFNGQSGIATGEGYCEHDSAGCTRTLDEVRTKAAFHDRLVIALQHLKQRIIAVAPEPDVKPVATEMKIEQREVRKPLRQLRVDI